MIDMAFKILRILQARPIVTRKELAKECRCCTRSVTRCIDSLTCNGFDIDTKPGKGGGIFLREGQR